MVALFFRNQSEVRETLRCIVRKMIKTKFLLKKYLILSAKEKNIGTATELANLIALQFETGIFPNKLTRDLVQNAYELENYGIKFSSERCHGARRIKLEILLPGDGSDSKNTPPLILLTYRHPTSIKAFAVEFVG